MFCSNCRKKINDDSVFCTTCNYQLQSKTSSSIDLNKFKSYFSIGLILFKKPSSYVQILKESLSPNKNLIFFIFLLLLIPISILVFSSLNLLLFNRTSNYIFDSIPISLSLIIIIFSILFNTMLLSFCYYIIKFFTKGIFKYNLEMKFDDLIRVSTLPILYLLSSYILGVILANLPTIFSSIILILGFILYTTTLFSGYKSLMPNFKIIPIVFTLSFSISLTLSIWITTKFIENAISSTFRFF